MKIPLVFYIVSLLATPALFWGDIMPYDEIYGKRQLERHDRSKDGMITEQEAGVASPAPECVVVCFEI